MALSGDRAGAILTLPLPKLTKDFTVTMEMDSAVSSMTPSSSSNANVLVTGDFKMRVVPSSGADLDDEDIRIDIEYDLKVCDKI